MQDWLKAMTNVIIHYIVMYILKCLLRQLRNMKNVEQR